MPNHIDGLPQQGSSFSHSCCQRHEMGWQLPLHAHLASHRKTNQQQTLLESTPAGDPGIHHDVLRLLLDSWHHAAAQHLQIAFAQALELVSLAAFIPTSNTTLLCSIACSAPASSSTVYCPQSMLTQAGVYNRAAKDGATLCGFQAGSSRCPSMESHLDVLWPPTLLLPACVGHHTVCAALIAPIDHVHPGGYVAVSPRDRHILQDLDGVCGHHLAPLVHLIQQLMQPAGRGDEGCAKVA